MVGGVCMATGEYSVHGVVVRGVNEVNSSDYDALVVVLSPDTPSLQLLEDFIADALLLDKSLHKNVSVLRCPRVSGQRLVLSSTGPLTPYDDVRSVYEAARAGMQRALAAGARRPVLAAATVARWPRSELVSVLGALEALYVSLQRRERTPQTAADALGVYAEGARAPLDALLREATALETGRGLARDIGGADPERMTPSRTADLLRDAFAGSGVSLRVLADAATIRDEYPLLAAVDRAARAVPRHGGCVVLLEYEPESYERTYMLVGKGVTYDTGGCDVKTGGAMVGMSYDKCGAAAVAGLVLACAALRPPVKVVAALAMVRNSVGEEAYVADELVVSRRGLTVRVGNTDAEGRMAMADLLAEMAKRADSERLPHLFTVATLTGHAVRAVGEGYTIAVDSHAASVASRLASEGATLADPVEVSTLRREDLAAHRGRAAGDDLLQAAPRPSTALPRGHQGPAAFLLLAAGLEAEGAPPYTHLDVAGSAGSLPASPTGAPLLALAALMGLVKSC